MRIHLPIAFLLLAGCSSHASKQDQLNAAANESTPAEANDLAVADQNRMNVEGAMNDAAKARAASSHATGLAKSETSSSPATNNSEQQATEPSQDEPGNSN